MFIIYGTGHKVVPLERRKPSLCAACGERQPHELIMRYEYSHLYWILRMRGKVEYFLCCEGCGSARKVSKDQVEVEHGPPRIPAFDRYGLLIGLILAVIGIPCLGLLPAALDLLSKRRR